MMKKWSDLSILEVADLYRHKEMSPVELVGNTFERLKDQ
jgi:aspartyl-tRNA(Asn)/glutamyl-tRNA(Gln) amidotransferase subunit A